MDRRIDVTGSFCPGDRVEVRSRFSGAWVSGFEVVCAFRASCRLRRLSDGAVLPVMFACRDVRLADDAGRAENEDEPCLDLVFENGDGSRLLVDLPAVLDIATVEAMRVVLMTAIDAATREVVLDLSRVEFLDSYGIRLLVMVRRRTWERDVSLALRGDKPLVRALLDLVGIDPMYHCLENTPQVSPSTRDNR